MPGGKGSRNRTRDLFSRKFRKHGPIHSTTYLRNYALGDLVDIKANSAVQKGMPHKYYHGRTGKIWNISKRAVGVEVNKLLGNRILKKRIHVRIEHVAPSNCQKSHIARIKRNEQVKKVAKETGVRVPLKRQPQMPRPGGIVKSKKLEVELVTPLKYELKI